MKIKQYKYEKKEVDSKEIELPKETSYYFETGIRRSIKIVPRFTNYNKKRFNKDEELYELEVEEENAHFSRLDTVQCAEAIWFCQQLLNDNRRMDLDFGCEPITPFYAL